MQGAAQEHSGTRTRKASWAFRPLILLSHGSQTRRRRFKLRRAHSTGLVKVKRTSQTTNPEAAYSFDGRGTQTIDLCETQPRADSFRTSGLHSPFLPRISYFRRKYLLASRERVATKSEALEWVRVVIAFCSCRGNARCTHDPCRLGNTGQLLQSPARVYHGGSHHLDGLAQHEHC